MHAASRRIGAAEARPEQGVSAEEHLFFFAIQTHGTRRMSRGVQHAEAKQAFGVCRIGDMPRLRQAGDFRIVGAQGCVRKHGRIQRMDVDRNARPLLQFFRRKHVVEVPMGQKDGLDSTGQPGKGRKIVARVDEQLPIDALGVFRISAADNFFNLHGSFFIHSFF